jgi:hypothetical protein
MIFEINFWMDKKSIQNLKKIIYLSRNKRRMSRGVKNQVAILIITTW